VFCGSDPFKYTAYFPCFARNIDISVVVYYRRLPTPELISPENRNLRARAIARYRLKISDRKKKRDKNKERNF